jgi:hypothetical protein
MAHDLATIKGAKVSVLQELGCVSRELAPRSHIFSIYRFPFHFFAKVCTLSRLSSYILQYDGGAVSFAALSRCAPKPSAAAAAAPAAAAAVAGQGVTGTCKQLASSGIWQQYPTSSVVDEEQGDEEQRGWCSLHGGWGVMCEVGGQWGVGCEVLVRCEV